MKVLVIGSGGREHALSWKLSLSPKVSQVFVATGNPGTQNEEKIININISPENITKLVDFAKNNIDELKKQDDYLQLPHGFRCGILGKR